MYRAELPRLVKIILQALRTWRSGGTPPTTHSNPLIQAALQDQAALGWRSFLEGLPCNKWTLAQEAYASQDKRQLRFSPGLWASQLIRWVWEIPWALWEHRNDWLHEKQHYDPAMAPVDKAIRDQLRLGTVGLDQETAVFFNANKDDVLHQHPENRRAWLKRVRKARQRDSERAMRRMFLGFFSSAQASAQT
jgi:hypothetical protein